MTCERCRTEPETVLGRVRPRRENGKWKLSEAQYANLNLGFVSYVDFCRVVQACNESPAWERYSAAFHPGLHFFPWAWLLITLIGLAALVVLAINNVTQNGLFCIIPDCALIGANFPLISYHNEYDINVVWYECGRMLSCGICALHF